MFIQFQKVCFETVNINWSIIATELWQFDVEFVLIEGFNIIEGLNFLDFLVLAFLYKSFLICIPRLYDCFILLI